MTFSANARIFAYRNLRFVQNGQTVTLDSVDSVDNPAHTVIIGSDSARRQSTTAQAAKNFSGLSDLCTPPFACFENRNLHYAKTRKQ